GVGAGSGGHGGVGTGVGGAGVGTGAGSGNGAGGGYGLGDPYFGAYGSPYPNRWSTRGFRIYRIQPSPDDSFAGGWFGSGAFDWFHQRALQPGWHVRRHAHMRDVHRSHSARRLNASLKPYEVPPKTLLDQKHVPSPSAPAPEAPAPTQAGQATAPA